MGMAEPHGKDENATKEGEIMTEADASTARRHEPPPPSSYVETHCKICAAGWTRTGEGGGQVVVCLLDREKVSPQLSSCSKFEREDALPRS